jgi:uncharacterized protein (TIGR04255 family)
MFDLAPVQRYRLARPPLVQAVVQLRFPVRAHLEGLEGVSPIQDRLETLFPYLTQQQTQSVAFVFGPGAPPPGPAPAQSTRIWQFSDDVGWLFALAPDNASLSIGPQYGSFAEFDERFRAILQVLSEVAGVTRCDRIGVRYIDLAEVTDPTNPNVWRDWFRPELTGWGATDAMGAATTLVASIAQTQLTARPTGDLTGPPFDVQAIIRHGYIPQGSVIPGLPTQPESAAFLLDMDLFVEGAQEFDVVGLADQLDLLHEQIDRFFRWSLAPAGEAYFGVEEVS